MKFIVTLLTSSLLAGLAGAAAAPDYSGIAKDVQILGKVLQTATEPGPKNSRFMVRNPSISGTYLARQGMLFNVEVRGAMARHWFSFSGPATPPVPPVPAMAGVRSSPSGKSAPDPIDPPDTPDPRNYGRDFNFNFSGDFGDIESFVEDIVEQFGDDEDQPMSAQARQYRDQMRAKLDEIRRAQDRYEKQVAEQEEALNDLEEKSRDGDKASRDKIRAALDKAREQLNKTREQYRATNNQFRIEQGKRWQEQLSALQDDMFDTLCTYAGSTRKLPANEYVTFVFRNAGGGDNGKDQIFVISRSDLDACMNGSQPDGYLRKKALSYSL